MAFVVEKDVAFAQWGREVVGARLGESSEVWMERLCDWCSANPRHPNALRLMVELPQNHGRHFCWAVTWALCAFPRVIVGHRLGASLMATSPGDDFESLTVAPWPAYLIEVPSELVQLDLDGKPVALDIVAVWHDEPTGRSICSVMSKSSELALDTPLTLPIPGFRDDGSGWAPALAHTAKLEQTCERAIECFERLVVGVELEMSSRTNIQAPRPRKLPRAPASGDAGRGVHRLTREVRVDCRAAIKDYIAGRRRTSPSVRHLTRGHWKRQAHGPGMSDRKWIQIEPYWSPKENQGPIAVRPHRIQR